MYRWGVAEPVRLPPGAWCSQPLCFLLLLLWLLVVVTLLLLSLLLLLLLLLRLFSCCYAVDAAGKCNRTSVLRLVVLTPCLVTVTLMVPLTFSNRRVRPPSLFRLGSQGAGNAEPPRVFQPQGGWLQLGRARGKVLLVAPVLLSLWLPCYCCRCCCCCCCC